MYDINIRTHSFWGDIENTFRLLLTHKFATCVHWPGGNLALPGSLVSVARTLLRCISSSCDQFEWRCSFRSELLILVPCAVIHCYTSNVVLMWRVRDLDDYSFVSVRPMVIVPATIQLQCLRAMGTADDSMSSNFAMSGSIKQAVKERFGSDQSPMLPLLLSFHSGGCSICFALTPVWTLRSCSTRWYAVKSSLRWDAFILAWDALFKWHALHCSLGRLKKGLWWQCCQGAK